MQIALREAVYYRTRKINIVFLLKMVISLRKRENQSPKGNMWSAIPVALLCMIEN